MTFLTSSEKRKIADAIKDVEHTTSAELVAVIAGAADTYRYIQLLWPALTALLLPGILLVVAPELAAIEIYIAQAAVFAMLVIILQVTPVRLAVIPKGVKYQRAHRLARLQFIEQGLHRTRDRTGVLIFVSVAERYVEIIADTGINDKVTPGIWDKTVAGFVAQIRAGRIAEGFLDAVKSLGDELAQHFPPTEDDSDELPNRLVEVFT